MKRIVFYLYAARGLATLKAVLAAGHELAFAVLPPGHDDVADACRGLGVETRIIENVNDPDFVTQVSDARATLGVIAGYSTIFKPPLIDAPEFGTINLHGGRLPEYRGGSPLNWQIINGEARAGISVIRVDAGIDTGPVLAEATFDIGPDETIREAHERANALFPGLVVEVIGHMEAGTLNERPQDEARAHYWRQRKPADGAIDWQNMTARQVHDLVRAVTRPYPGARAASPTGTLHIFETRMPAAALDGSPGQVIDGEGPGNDLCVACAEGAVLLTDYEVEGGGGLSTGMTLS